MFSSLTNHFIDLHERFVLLGVNGFLRLLRFIQANCRLVSLCNLFFKVRNTLFSGRQLRLAVVLNGVLAVVGFCLCNFLPKVTAEKIC